MSLHYIQSRLVLVFGFVLASSFSNAIEADEDQFFQTTIQPILENRCLKCHNQKFQKAGISLDSYHGIQNSLKKHPNLFQHSNGREGLLLRMVQETDPGKRMPPKEPKLSNMEISQLRKWAQSNGKTSVTYKTDSFNEHWAFEPLPQEKDPAHSVDYFISKKLTETGLTMSAQENEHVLLRRLHLVITGLPPSPKDLKRFLSNKNPGKWKSKVNQLLDNKNYGEHMASFWLDVARFGETDGFETNRERPDAWPYRDWVIKAFNSDIPYNEFIIHQIAGDVTSQPVGTSFLVAGPVDIVKGQDKRLGLIQRQNELDDIAHTTLSSFMGLTLGCARCHDHKFDPISQEDYYSVQAVFSGVHHGSRTVETSTDEEQLLQSLNKEKSNIRSKISKLVSDFERPAVTFDLNVESFSPRKIKFIQFNISSTLNGAEPCIDELEVYSGKRIVSLSTQGVKATSNGDFKHPLHKLEHINDGAYGNSKSWISAHSSGGWVRLEFPTPVSVDKIIWARDREKNFKDRLPVDYSIQGGLSTDDLQTLSDSKTRIPFKHQDELDHFSSISNLVPKADRQTLKEHIYNYKRIVDQIKAISKKTKIYAGTFRSPEKSFVLYRGEPDSPKNEVGPASINYFGKVNFGLNSTNQERRLALAQWIASEQNPLTARVMVNRIWQIHFGRGLVSSANDFGINGSQPTHPELLDYLATQLIENNWSIKHIQRLILNSKTWRQSSSPNTNGLKFDSQGSLYWRFTPRRMRAEMVRDSILFVSGTLNEKFGGPGFSGFQVDMENVRHYHPLTKFGPNEWRRMIYMTKVRQEKESVFGIFDCPDGSQSIGQRSNSTTPLQALNLFNSPFVIQQAEYFAKSLNQFEDSNIENSIKNAFLKCFTRHPTQHEISISRSFIKKHGLESFTRALLNSNEFIHIF